MQSDGKKGMSYAWMGNPPHKTSGNSKGVSFFSVSLVQVNLSLEFFPFFPFIKSLSNVCKIFLK